VEEGGILIYRSRSFSCLGRGFVRYMYLHPLDTDIMSWIIWFYMMFMVLGN